MYPSTMKQNNIGFDTFYGFVIDPLCYKLLGILEKILGTKDNFPTQLLSNFAELIVDFANNKSIGKLNKKNFINHTYIILINALIVLKKHNIPLDKIYNPSNITEYYLLKSYLLPILDILIRIHKNSEDYNIYMYDYLINNDINKYNEILVLENYNEPNIKVNKIKSSNFQEYIIKNNLIPTITGALFYTHEFKKSIIYDFINDRLRMRKEYKNKRDSSEYGSDLYNFYDLRQSTAKINVNSLYGLTGMSSFRFSNKHLAKATTIGARLCLKIAQICTELYLNNLEKE